MQCHAALHAIMDAKQGSVLVGFLRDGISMTSEDLARNEGMTTAQLYKAAGYLQCLYDLISTLEHAPENNLLARAVHGLDGAGHRAQVENQDAPGVFPEGGDFA